MIYYLFAFLIYAMLVAQIHRISAYPCSLQTSNHFSFWGILPFALLVHLRGPVGTDSSNYIEIIKKINTTGTFEGLELGFIYLIKGVLYISQNPLFICILIAVITTGVLLTASNTHVRAKFIFLACIAPVFYLDMTMNGLRYGLSFSFAMLAIAKFYQNKLVSSIGLAIISVLLHVSGFLLFLIVAITADSKEKFNQWVKLLISLSPIVLIQLFFTNHTSTQLNATAKYLAYCNIVSPTWYSGISTLILSLLTIYVLYKSENTRNSVVNHKLAALCFLAFLTFIIAKFSYAGLRLQLVLLFGMLLIMQYEPAFANVMKTTRKTGTLIIGYLGLLVSFKNIISTHGQGASPFSPYLFNPYIVELYTKLLNG